MRTWNLKVESKVLILGIDNVICDTLASIVWAELCNALTNHDPVERHERWFCEWDLKPNLEPKSFKEWWEAKHWNNVNKVIRKMVKPQSKNNMTFEDVISFLEIFRRIVWWRLQWGGASYGNHVDVHHKLTKLHRFVQILYKIQFSYVHTKIAQISCYG